MCKYERVNLLFNNHRGRKFTVTDMTALSGASRSLVYGACHIGFLLGTLQRAATGNAYHYWMP